MAGRPLSPMGLLGLVLAAVQPLLVRAQFGGGGYTPPAPICPAFKCSAGEVAVGKTDHQLWSYGCKESGMNVFDASSFDPNNPSSFNKGGTNLDKCCIEKDICKQTCGKTSKECHDSFQKCTTKTCKGNQNCQLQAMMAEIMSEPYEAEEDKAKKYDPEETKCKAYNRGQKEACTCVPKGELKSANEAKLRSFYGKFNPEKLNKDGEIKDVDDVWKKWKGKEPDMFMALATKYKAKAVEMRQKPKPPPYKPPPADSAGGAAEDFGAEEKEEPRESAPEPEAPSDSDPEEASFEQKRTALEAKKKKAKEDEDYDLAQETKEMIDKLTQAEVKKLKDKKAKAIDDEDYISAKKIKARLARLSEL